MGAGRVMTGAVMGVCAAMTHEINIPAARGLPASAVILLTALVITALFAAVYVWRLWRYSQGDAAAWGFVAFHGPRDAFYRCTGRWV